MISNYLKIAFRNLLKYRMISSINFLGLTVGLVCCVLILIYVLNELSYDRMNPNAERIYRITRSFHNDDGSESLHLAAIGPAFGPRLKTDFPEMEKMTRMLSNGATTIRYEDKLFNEENGYYADESFFDFFNVPVLKGNPSKALTDPHCIMLSEDLAKKYFGNEDPINKLLKIDNRNPFKVTGVFSDFPANSHFRPTLLLSFNSLKDSTIYGEKRLNRSWSNNAFFTYVMLPENTDAKSIEAHFPAFIDKHMASETSPGIKMSKYTKLYLQKLTDIHLRSNYDSDFGGNGDIKRVYIFSCIALFILLVACINYMNLSTARSTIRSKEIGIRKAIGAQRKEIIWQFLSESVLVAFISLLGAMLLSFVVLPFVNSFSSQQLAMQSLFTVKIIASLLALPFIVGILSGIYPALFMSGFNTVKTLKGVFRVDTRGLSFRKVLVVSQFAISIILIITTVVVYRQLDFMQNTSLGFNKEKVITMYYYGDMNGRYESFKNEALADPSVRTIGRSSTVPTARLLDDLGAVSVAEGDSMKRVANADLKFISVDQGFIPTYDLAMAAGRNFSKEFNDSNSFILNEAAIKMLGWKNPDEAVGKMIRYGKTNGKIVGVIKNFHFESMRENIIPLLFSPRADYSMLSVKITNAQPALATLEKLWAKYLPEVPFGYSFMEERVGRLYRSEQQQSKLFTIFSCISILIACLGLFGLSAFTISQRVKEIGVRKVLGAGISEIVTVLSIDFLRLVIIAVLIGLPLSWYAMSRWLQDFAYRIDIPWWALLLASATAIFIAFATVSIQALKAAFSNPVKSLRTE